MSENNSKTENVQTSSEGIEFRSKIFSDLTLPFITLTENFLEINKVPEEERKNFIFFIEFYDYQDLLQGKKMTKKKNEPEETMTVYFINPKENTQYPLKVKPEISYNELIDIFLNQYDLEIFQHKRIKFNIGFNVGNLSPIKILKDKIKLEVINKQVDNFCDKFLIDKKNCVYAKSVVDEEKNMITLRCEEKVDFPVLCIYETDDELFSKLKTYVQKYKEVVNHKITDEIINYLIIQTTKENEAFHIHESKKLYFEFKDISLIYKGGVKNNIINLVNEIDNEKVIIGILVNAITEYLKYVQVMGVECYNCPRCNGQCFYVSKAKVRDKEIEKMFSAKNRERLQLSLKSANAFMNSMENLLNDNSNTGPKTNQLNVVYFSEKNKNINKVCRELEHSIGGFFVPCDSMTSFDLIKQDSNGWKFILIIDDEKFINLEKEDFIYKLYFYDYTNKTLNVKGINSKMIFNDYEMLKEELAKYETLNLYKTFRVINLNDYNSKMNKLHKIIAKYYGKTTHEDYNNGISLIKGFIDNSKNLQIVPSKRTKRLTNKEKLDVQKKSLINVLQIFEDPDKNCEKVISYYTKEKDSFYQDINRWLNDKSENTYNKIGYFIASFQYCLNYWAVNKGKGINEDLTLYRGFPIRYIDLLNYVKNIGQVITFPSFTSTSKKYETAEEFSLDKSDENQFSVVLVIIHKRQEDIIPHLIDINDLSSYDEGEILIQSCSFYKILDVKINFDLKTAEVQIQTVCRKKILEKSLKYLEYDEKENIMKNKEGLFLTYINNENYEVETRIIGKDFFKHNKEKISININGQEMETKSKFNLPPGENIITITLKSPIYDFSYMFDSCFALSNIDGLSTWEVGQATVFDYMFSGCHLIYDVNGLKNWDVSNGRCFRCMFGGCSSLTDLEGLKNWNVSKGQDFRCMFHQCSSLNNLDSLINWNMSNGRDFYAMFDQCYNLKNLDGLKLWNVCNGKDFINMFYGCFALNSIDGLYGWDVKKGVNFSEMFYNCISLTNLDALKRWKVQNGTNFSEMFYNCEKITDLNALKNWDVSNGINFSNMFTRCLELSDIRGIENWNVKKGKNFDEMFNECPELNDKESRRIKKKFPGN